MIKKFIREFERFETHHKILVFIGFLVLTILITRGIVLIKNPTPILAGFELHHFDYGLILLIISCLLLLFAKKQRAIFLVMASIAIGLIIDDVWFIRGNLNDPGQLTETLIYSSTFKYVPIILVIVILLAFLIEYYFSKK